jgi:hypothetical protein
MNIRPISEWTLYRLRFAIAYGFLAVLAVALLLLYGNAIPPGLGPSEQQSIITSSNIDFTKLPTEIVDLPYHILQKLSIEWLGITPLGVRLPSLVLGGLTALCLVLVLRRWFTQNVAILAGVIIITSSWFLGMGRIGNPTIMIPFWTSVLLLTATYVSQQTKSWKWWRVSFAMSAAISMYTPFMAYMFVAAGLASVAQPHLRYLLRESNRVNLFIGGFFFLLMLVPLGWGVYHNPDLARELLAVPAALPDPLQFLRDFMRAASALLNPFNTSNGEVTLPLLSVVCVALLLMGGARLLKDFHSVRAHVLLIWAAVLLPIIGLNPNNLAVMLVPAMLVVTIGLHQIIRYWYKLFPLNPYARLFGLLPLAILVFSIVQVDYQRYTFGMLYSAKAGSLFVPDAFMVQQEITRTASGTNVTVVVPENQRPLYQIMTARRTGTVVMSGAFAQDRSGKWIVSPGEIPPLAQLVPMAVPTKILVDDRKDTPQHSSERFIVYQR